MSIPASLYEEDFYAWTQQQAELLRRLPAVGNELDLEHTGATEPPSGWSDAWNAMCRG
jgi:Domain of unknown function DUF29